MVTTGAKMKHSFKKGMLAAALSVASIQPAYACWDDAAKSALKVKHLNTMMMATALRCRNTSDDFLAEYNLFVTKHNLLLGRQNAIVRTELAKSLGANGAMLQSDNLSVGFANTYGAGHPSMDCAALRELVATVSVSEEDENTLALLADQVLQPTIIPGEECNVDPLSLAEK
jgi:hypothetical protein